jgi:hypothetical protein
MKIIFIILHKNLPKIAFFKRFTVLITKKQPGVRLPKLLTFGFCSAGLLTQVHLDAHLGDLVELCLQPIDMNFLVLEDGFE